jgi:dinuclear metal center YbgI/SA1388 family protein
MKIQDVINRIETYAPLHFQESYDNSGIQVGNSSMEVKGILLTIDITEEVLEEAVIKGCNLVIAHHPLIFLSQKKITGSNYIQRCIIFAIKHDITIYASHTNMDKVRKGVSWKMAEKINLKRCKPLAIENEYRLKLVTFVPTNKLNKLQMLYTKRAQASSAITAVAVIVLQDLAVLKHQTSVTRSVVT